MSIKNLLKMLVTSCYSLLHLFFIHFHFAVVSVEDVQFFKSVSFVTLVSAVSGRLCL